MPNFREMGVSSHSVENFGVPFLLVDELVFIVPKGGVLRLPRHHFKLLFILSGQVEHEIEGWDGRRSLGAGAILVAPIVKKHLYINVDRAKEARVHAVRLFLDADHLQEQAGRRVRRPEADLSDYVLHHFTRVAQIDDGIDAELNALLNSLRREAEQRGTGFRHRVRALCTELIIAVSRKLSFNPSRDAPGNEAKANFLINSVKEFVLKHLSEDISLGQIAWHVGKGEEHLARLFKRQTGQTVFNYVREMRVARAKTYLLDSSLTLTEIAERCGFRSLSFFSRTFSQQAGLSPSAYRLHTETVVRPLTTQRSRVK